MRLEENQITPTHVSKKRRSHPWLGGSSLQKGTPGEGPYAETVHWTLSATLLCSWSIRVSLPAASDQRRCLWILATASHAVDAL